MQADRLHTQVEAYLDELRAAGLDMPPNSTGRSLCVAWMRDQWLYRVNGPTAKRSIRSPPTPSKPSTSSSRCRANGRSSRESRLTTILDAVRRWALEASPDADARIERLNAQIAELEAERDRLADGGEVNAASEDRMLDGFVNLIDLIAQLPSDFKRVEESVARDAPTDSARLPRRGAPGQPRCSMST